VIGAGGGSSLDGETPGAFCSGCGASGPLSAGAGADGSAFGAGGTLALGGGGGEKIDWILVQPPHPRANATTKPATAIRRNANVFRVDTMVVFLLGPA
jgi:hypothetical protein